MSNRLSMAKIHSIEALYQSGHSNREIARLLGVDRGAVNRYVGQLRIRLVQKRPNPQTGSDNIAAAENQPNPQTGFGENAATEHPPTEPAESSPGPVAEAFTLAEPVASGGLAKRPAVLSGPTSSCEPLREVIESQLEQGLSITRIHQDLRIDHGFTGSYHSVRRFVLRLSSNTALPFRRLETLPGEEAQIDFGTAAPVISPQGKQRRPWMLRVVLSCSRKAYSEVVDRQTTDNFLAVIENAFHYFGGVPKRLVIDNLKAAVHRADWYDPELHPKLQSFAAHYNTAFVPTKPYTPRHKGKVENGVKYVKHNALKSRIFQSLEQQNQYLLNWEQTIADKRIHGTTKKQVQQQFEQLESDALLGLPRDRFPMFHEARRTVSRDGHLEVDKAFYSTPPEYVGRRLWVRWDARLVRIFNEQWQPIALHSKCEPGRFRTDAAHIPAEKVSAVERGTDALLRQIATIGPHTKAWGQATISVRGIEGVRVLVGLKALAGKHESAALEAACETALRYGAHRLRTIRELLKRAAWHSQQQFDFIEEHPLIRPLADYSLTSLQSFRKERFHES